MANVLEILIRARDEASAKLKATQAEVAKTKAVVASLSPQLSAATGQFGQMAEAAAAFGPIGIAIVAVTVALAGMTVAASAAITAVDALASSTEQLTNLAQKTGVSTQQLQGLQFAFQNAGIAADSLNTGLRFLAKSIADDAPELAQLGVKSKNVGEAFLEIADAFANSADGANKTAFAIRLLGRAGSDLIPVLNLGSEALREQQREAAAMGKILGTDSVTALGQADKAMDELKNRVEALKVQVTLLAVPAVTDLVKALNTLLRSALELPSALESAGAGLSAFVDKIPGGKQLQDFLAYIRALERLANAAKGGEKSGFQNKINPATGGPFGGVTGPQNQLPTPGAPAVKTVFDTLKEIFPDTSGTAKPKMAESILKVGDAVAVVSTRLTEFGQTLRVLEDFREEVNQVLDVSNIVGETLATVWDSLQNSMSQVFQSLLARGQTFKSAMVTIFRGLVDGILAELARLAAAYLFKLLLKVLGIALGGPAGAAATVAAGATGEALLSPVGPSATLAGAAPVNVQIMALDSQSIDDAYRSRGGSFRVYERRAAARRGF